jgi:hypothetical protein
MYLLHMTGYVHNIKFYITNLHSIWAIFYPLYKRKLLFVKSLKNALISIISHRENPINSGDSDCEHILRYISCL